MNRTMAVVMTMAMAGVTLAAAQSRPNFSGSWVLVPEQSDTGRAGSMPGGAMAGMPGGMMAGRMGGRRGDGRTGGASGMSGMSGGLGAERVQITQTVATLTIAAEETGETTTYVYNLDGSESRNTVPSGRRGGTPSEMISKAVWDGNKLAITTDYSVNAGGNNMTMRVTQTVSMTGGELTVETTIGGMMGMQPTTRKSVYRKA